MNDAVLDLSKQELFCREHDEKTVSVNRDNFKKLLNLLIGKYPLKRNLNELMECISSYINDHIGN